MQDTPPHVKAAIQPAAIKEKAIKKSFKVNQFPATPTGGGGHQLDVVNESLFEDSDRPIKAAKPNHSQTIAENSRHYRKESPNVSLNAHKVLSSLEESRGSSSVLSTNRSHDSSVHNSRSISTPAGGAHTNKGGSSAGVLPNVPRKRNSDGGHIQLEVISGDKLIPAKKGAAKEGNPAADRKPCLKVVFYVPASSAGGNSAPSTPAVPKSPGGAQSDINNGLKKVFQQSKDFNVITLNPKWNCSFIINLPFSKSVLKTIIERNQLQHSYSHAGALNDSEYDTICKAMLQYWSTGTLEIEVFDGERFNEDIFMGKVQLLITSFHPMIKKFHELEMKGNFTLEKSKPKDRVSGSIYLIAYLHVPEKKYVEEQILQVLTSIKYQEIESQNQQQQQQHQNKRKSVSKTSSMYMNEDSSADDGGNDSSSDAYSNKNNRRFSSQAEIKKSSIPTRLSIIPESSASSSSKNNQPTASRNQTITANNFAKKVPMPSSAPTISPPTKTPTSTTPPNTNLSTFMKSFAVQKIQSQDNLNILLGEPNLEESFNINLPAQPAPAISTSSTTSNQHHNHQTPNSIYFRTPSSLYTPQTQQTEGSGNSSASSSVKRPLSARAVSMDPGGSTPPITSLDEIRGSNIHVSSIVSKEAAIESKVVKRNFLEDMAKQLSGLEAIVNQSNDKAIVENISKKLQSKKLSQVIDMNSKSSIPQPKSSIPVNPEDDLARMKSPSRLPSSYHPKATNSPTTSNSTKPVNKAASSYHPGRTSISKGLVDLKLHVNLTVQNLEKFLDDIPLLDPEEEKGDKSSDSDDEDPHFTKPFAENHPNKHKKDPLQLTKSSPASKISPSKVPVFQKKYYEQGVDADESDSEQLYEEDEDNQFRKHSVNTPLASARTDSPKKIVSLHHRPLPPPPPPPPQRKTVIVSDSDDSDSEDFRIPAKGAFKEDDKGRAYSNASEEHDLEQSKYLEKRISVRDQSNQHIFKYHNPDSPHKHTPSKFSFNAASETTVTTPPQPVSKSSTGNNGIASTKFKSSSKEDESISYLSNSFDYSSPGAVSPVVPPRSSSKQVYEGKSLSQSDIDELSQRVKLLSRLSYSSTDGESHHTQNNPILELSRSKSSEDPKFGNTPLKKIQSTPMKDNDNGARKKVEVVQSPSTNLINQGSVAPSILLPVEKKLPSSIETVSEKQKAIHEIPRSPDFTNRTEGLRVATTPSSIPKFRRGQKDATPIKQPPPPPPPPPPPILPSSSTDSIDTPERKKIPPRSAKASATKVAGKEVKKRVATSRTGKATIHLDEVDL